MLADRADVQFNVEKLDQFQMLHQLANKVVGNVRTEFLERQFGKLMEFEKLDAISDVIEKWPNEDPAMMIYFKGWAEKLAK